MIVSSNQIPAPRRANRGLADVGRAAEAMVMLALARLSILFLPFQALMSHLVLNGGMAGSEKQLGSLRLAISRAASRAPFRAKCFEQALAAHWMLRRRGLSSTVHYGLSSGGEALRAHVWLASGSSVVVGAEAMSEFSEVARWPVG